MSDFVVQTRQKNDVLFETSDPLGIAGAFTSGVMRVSGYSQVSFLGISDQAFTIDVLEAGEDANGDPGTFVLTQTLTSAFVGSSQEICDRIQPCGSFMRIVLSNTSGLAMTVLSLLGQGIPVAGGSGTGGGGGTGNTLGPVVGGSGTLYLSIAAAIAGESAIPGQADRITGLVPQAGTTNGLLVGPGTLSAVSGTYVGYYVVNTDQTPATNLVAQWARVSAYDGPTRTLTLDKPFDFATESDFVLVKAIRIALLKDVAENVTFATSVELDLAGHRLEGTVDCTGDEFHWIRGGTGYITSGIQKSVFGLLKMDDCQVSRRDATLYSLLMTEGSDLGRTELSNCTFYGVVAGRRGRCGWRVVDCQNQGVNDPTTNKNIPWRLMESVGAIIITPVQIDIFLDTPFSGAFFYSENVMGGGGSCGISVRGRMTMEQSKISILDNTATNLDFGFVTVVGAGGFSATLAGQGVLFAVLGGTMVGGISINLVFEHRWSLLRTINASGTILFDSTGQEMDISFTGSINVRNYQSEGTSNTTATITLSQGSQKKFAMGNGNFASVDLSNTFTGSLTLSGAAAITLNGSALAYLVLIGMDQTAGAPTITVSCPLNYIYAGTQQFALWDGTTSGSSTVSVGTWVISGTITSIGCRSLTYFRLGELVSGGSWTLSGAINNLNSMSNQANASTWFTHSGTGGSLLVSASPIVWSGGAFASWKLAATNAAGAGTATLNISSANIRVEGVGSRAAVNLCQCTGDGTTTTVSGIINFSNCIFSGGTHVFVNCGSTATFVGPSSVTWEYCAFRTAFTTETGAGTFTWTGATWIMKWCCNDALFTVVGTRFLDFESIQCCFRGNSSNNSVSFSGVRPATYRYWQCTFNGREDAAGTPDVIDTYHTRPAAGAQTAANLVTLNASAQSTNVVGGTNVVTGPLVNSPGAANEVAQVMVKGKMMVASSAGVLAGDHLVADTGGTPTSVVTNAASVSGKNVGFALEAVGATVANQVYAMVDMS